MKALLVVALGFAATPAAASPCDDLAATICPAGKATDACKQLVAREMKSPDGKRLDDAQRDAVCKATLADAPALAALRNKAARAAVKHTYRIAVIAQDRKADGSSWDAFGGAPDIDLCFEDDAGKFCVAPAGRPSCNDNLVCAVEVALAEKQPVMLDVIDVDARDHDPIGSCALTPPAAGKALADCAGELVSVEIVRAEE